MLNTVQARTTDGRYGPALLCNRCGAVAAPAETDVLVSMTSFAVGLGWDEERGICNECWQAEVADYKDDEEVEENGN